MYVYNNDKKYLKYMKLIFSWIHIITKFVTQNCIKELHIDIYYSDEKKQITSNNLTMENINSGFTTGGCNKTNKIVIFRKEEWFKVLIHETFHALALDFSYKNNTNINSMLYKQFPLNIEFKSYESYCETWALLWNTLYHTFNENSNNFSDFINIFRNKYTMECIFSYYQMNKILNHLNLKYTNLYNNDLISQNVQRNYKENTSIISYFVFKTIIIQNINDFFNFCEGQTNLISLWSSGKNDYKYTNLIISNYQNIKFTSHNFKKDKGLRWTLHDFA
jgi:hypothetical protein